MVEPSRDVARAVLAADVPVADRAVSEAGLALERAVDWFLVGWASEGPKVPSRDTVRTYSWHLRSFTRFAHEHGKMDVGDALEPDFVRRALRKLMDEPGQHGNRHKGGEAAAAGLAQATKRFARWLVAQGIAVPNLSVVKAPRPPQRDQPRLLPDEFSALKAAVVDQLVNGKSSSPQVRAAQVSRDLALIYLLADTGLRCNEVVNVTIDDVDFLRGCIFVRRGKGNKQRTLSIVDANDPQGGTTLRLLSDWIKIRETVRHTDHHTRLWVSVPMGQPLSHSTLRRVLQSLCVAAGLDGSRPPHAFRRAHFTEQYRASPESIKVLSARMGWAEGSQMETVYTRGAHLNFAAEVPMRSLATQWGGAPQLPAIPARVSPAALPTARKRGARTNGKPAVDDLVAAVKSDPQLRQALITALLGGAA